MYARVAVARPIPEPLTYGIPAHMGEISVGTVVQVPLGRTGETGYVVECVTEPGFDPAKVKPISRVLDPVPVFTSEQLAFFEWIASYYLCPLGLVIHTAMPSQMTSRTLRVLVASEAGIERLTDRSLEGVPAQVLREIISRPQLTKSGLVRRLAGELDRPEVEKAIDSLARGGLANWEDKEVGGTKGKIRTIGAAATAEALAIQLPRAGRRMKALFDLLCSQDGHIDLSDLISQEGESARPSLKRLEQAGLITYGERENRDALSDAKALGPSLPPDLNEDQLAALVALTAEGAKGAFLLFGVTGSGKTEVFLGAAQATMDRGQQVLVLVPEIGLTPQLVGRFRARFGLGVAVLHSGLTGGERLAQWRRIRAGEAQVAVGARSALFAPFHDLGLIVVDEEHDDSYKQDDAVPYNARDLAVVLGQKRGCPVVLASATPALETYHNARAGRYKMLRLPNRATARTVPEIELVDLTELDATKGQTRPLLAPAVEAELRETFARGGQAIVLYNRRGYATMVQCVSCGGTYECPNCGITMTLHKQAWRMSCHYCGLKRAYSEQCPVCHDHSLEEVGKGTERIEEVLRGLFPGVAVARMDADTTKARGAHERILTAFREGRTQLLVGTQIVAKGHDFPDVHTAVVISADRGFRIPDFRSAERTFALLVQMAGRAGRGDHPGRVLVQTYKPDHYVLSNLRDVERFYQVELRLRSTLRYPPFSRLCLIRLDGVDRAAVNGAAEKLARDLRDAGRQVPGLSILGPAPAALPRLVGRWRFQIVLRGEKLAEFRNFLRNQKRGILNVARKGIRIAIDVDPRHLM